jgi:type I restriction enzyme S subunit
MKAADLITDHMDTWIDARTPKPNGGRGCGNHANGRNCHGIKKLRELILELAVRGKLVPQDPDDEPASVLLEKISQEKEKLIKEGKINKQKPLPKIHEEEKPFELPKGWVWERLAKLTIKIGSGSTPRGGKNAYVAKGIPFFRSQNIWNDGLHVDDVVHIPHETHEKMSATIVFPMDILLNITGASLGRCTLIPDNFDEANVSQHVTIIRCANPSLRKFLHLFFISSYCQKIIWTRQVGMAREGLSKKVLEQFEIPLPPLPEQHRIVAKVDELMTLCDALKDRLSEAGTIQVQLADAIAEKILNCA